MKFRIEKDSMGAIEVPNEAHYGSQTQRAILNFPISGQPMPASFIQALAYIKLHSAQTNMELGLLNEQWASAIISAAQEVIDQKHPDQFLVDVFQTGSGTSTNMNMNEVLASIANETITGQRGGKKPVHPNDHVNMGQSSNDIIPSALHLAAAKEIKQRLLPALSLLQTELSAKAAEFQSICKLGRTHLQDAVPMTLGDEFSGYARQMEISIERLQSVLPEMGELALGGTAVGTGLNTHPEFAPKTIARMAGQTGLPLTKAKNHFEAQGAQDAVVSASGALKTTAVGFYKIANDLRWLGSGPRCGLGEINLPSLQPGSSIMPGKINPVMCEMAMQVSAQVIGCDAAISIGGLSGVLELNVMLPVMVYNLLTAIDLLCNATTAFAEKCVRGITANEKICRANIEKSLAMITGFVPHIGYDLAAEIAKEAHQTGKTIRQVAIERELLAIEIIEDILSYPKK